MFIGIGLQMTGGGLPPFYPDASLALDFAAGRYKGSDGLVRSDLASVPGWSFSRTGAGTAEDTSGVYSSFAANTPRRTNKGLLVEEARTNAVRNNTMAGAVNGTVGAAGALPTNWSRGDTNGLALDVVGTGTEYGLPYIDLRLYGTTTNTVHSINFENRAALPASPGQAWVSFFGVRVVGGALTNVTAVNSRIIEWNAGAYLRETNAAVAASAVYARAQAIATVGASVTQLSSQVAITHANGVLVDVTLRVYAPDLENAAFPLSPVLTTGAAATRGADVATQAVSAMPSEFTVCWEGVLSTRPASGANALLFEFHDGTASNRFHVRVEADGAVNAQVTNGGTSTQFGPSASGTVVGGASFKAAVRRMAGSWRLFINGVAIGSETAAALPVVSTLDHARARAAVSYINGFEKLLVVYPHTNPITGFTA